MNGRLITAEEKAESRRRQDRRRRRNRVATKRARLLSQLDGRPEVLALLEAGLVGEEAILGLWCGRVDEVRRRVRQIQIMAAAVGIDSAAAIAPAPVQELVPPARVLHRRRRGIPVSSEVFREEFRRGIHIADATRRVVFLPGVPGTLAYFDAATMSEMLPGLRVPIRLRRRAYLLRWGGDAGVPGAGLDVFGCAGKELFHHPLPASLLDPAQDREKVAGEADSAGAAGAGS